MEGLKDQFRTIRGNPVRLRNPILGESGAEYSWILTGLYIDGATLVLGKNAFSMFCKAVPKEELTTLIVLRYLFVLNEIIKKRDFLFLGFHTKKNLVRWYNEKIDWPGVRNRIERASRLGYIDIIDESPPIIEFLIFYKDYEKVERWALDARSRDLSAAEKRDILQIAKSLKATDWTIYEYPSVSRLSLGDCTILDIVLVVFTLRVIGFPASILAYSNFLGQDSAARKVKQWDRKEDTKALEITEVAALQFTQWATKRIFHCLKKLKEIETGVTWTDATIGTVVDSLLKCKLLPKEKATIERKLVAPILALNDKKWREKLLQREVIHLREIAKLTNSTIEKIRERLKAEAIDIFDPFAIERHMKNREKTLNLFLKEGDKE